MASNALKGQAKYLGAKTTSHNGRAGHVITHVPLEYRKKNGNMTI